MNYKEEIENTIMWIQETVAQTGFSKVIIAVSGGVDSAVSVTLAAKALGVENVYVALFPYGDLHSHGVDDAKLLIEKLQIPEDQVFTIDIKSSVNEILHHVILSECEGSSQKDQPSMITNKEDSSPMVQNDSIRKGNIMARVRMIYLFDLAKKLSAIVCGTENKTESYLGYFTRFGDEASDIEPIKKFYKTQIWELAKELDVPAQIITKAPTAGLWEGQTDENELGFSYKDADTVLSYRFDQGLTAGQIVEKGIFQEVVVKVLARVTKNDFKHKLPYINK